MGRKKKSKNDPKLTAEEYKELTGQGLGSLYNGSNATITKVTRDGITVTTRP